MRKFEVKRETKETKIILSLNLDGCGKSEISTGCGFFDHMLTLFAHHSNFDIILKCNGDTHIDYHHTVEDIGICLGKAFAEALGDMKGINRYGNIILPMDESLILCAVDISGRSFLDFNLPVSSSKVGDFDTELAEEFFLAFVRNAGITLHINKMAGTNTHHIIEGAFKAFARTLNQAASINEKQKDVIPSTKGML